MRRPALSEDSSTMLLLSLIQVALAVQQSNVVEAFLPGRTSPSRAKIRFENDGRCWSSRPVDGPLYYYSPPDTDEPDDEACQSSHILSITSTNIAGMVNDDGEDSTGIHVNFAPNLNVVTGESGTGKSLLVAKAIDLVTGGKADSSLIQPSGESVEQESFSAVELSK